MSGAKAKRSDAGINARNSRIQSRLGARERREARQRQDFVRQKRKGTS